MADNGLGVLLSIHSDDAQHQKLMKKLVNETQIQLKKAFGITMNPKQILESFTQINAIIDTTSGKVNQLNANLRMASGRNINISGNVDYYKTGNVSGFNVRGLSETANIDKQMNKYMSLTGMIVKKQKEINAIEYKDFITDNDRELLARYNNELERLKKQRQGVGTLLDSTGGTTNIQQMYSKASVKEQDAIAHAKQLQDKKNAREKKRLDNEESARQKKILKEYESGEKRIAEIKRETAKINVKGKDAFTENDKKILNQYNKEFEKLVSNSKKLKKEINTFKTPAATATQSKVDTIQSKTDVKQKEAQDLSTERQRKKVLAQITAEGKKYEATQKEILRLKKEIWQQESKANSSSKEGLWALSNLKQSLKIEEENARVSSTKLRKTVEGTTLANNTQSKYNRLQRESESLIKAQYSANKSLFKDMMSGWKEATARIVNYTVIYRSIWGIIQGFQAGVQTIADLNKSFTDIQMVTGASDIAMQNLSKTYVSLAKEMGSTTSQVAEGATEWLRQGKTIQETNDLLKQTMILSKTGAMESSEATEYLTSTINGYKMEVEDASKIVDVFSALDMSAATSSKELAIAFARTANSAHDAGMGFEELAGWITTVSETTRRSASSVGESFKTVFARLQNVKLGVAIDPESGEAINDVEKALNGLGIQLRTSPTDWRNATDVLDEIGKNWDTYNDKQKNMIVTSIAGVRQAEMMRAAFNNFDGVLENINTAYNSAGSAAEKYGTYLESIESKQNRLITTFQDIAYQPGFENLYKQVLDLGIAFGEVANVVINFPGTLPVIVAGFVALAAPSIYGGISKLIMGFQSLGEETLAIQNSLGKTGLKGALAFNRIARQASGIDRLVMSLKAESMADTDLLIKEQQVITARSRDIAVRFTQIEATEKSIVIKKAEKMEYLETTLGIRKETAEKIVNGVATKSLSVSVALLTVELKTMAMAMLTNPMTWVFVAITAVFALKQLYDKLNVTLAEQKEIVKDLKSEYEGLLTEVESLRQTENRTDAQNKKLKGLEDELAVQKSILDVETERQNAQLQQKYGYTAGGQRVNTDSNSTRNMQRQSTASDSSEKVKKDMEDIAGIQKEMVELEDLMAEARANGLAVESETYQSKQKEYDALVDKLGEIKISSKETYDELVLLAESYGANVPESLQKTINAYKVLYGITPMLNAEAIRGTDIYKQYANTYKDYTADMVESAKAGVISEIAAIQTRIAGYNEEIKGLQALSDARAVADKTKPQHLKQIQNIKGLGQFGWSEKVQEKVQKEQTGDLDKVKANLAKEEKRLAEQSANLQALIDSADSLTVESGYTPEGGSSDSGEDKVLEVYKANKAVLDAEIALSKSRQELWEEDTEEWIKEAKYQKDKYIELQNLAHKEAQRLRALGYAETSEQISQLKEDYASAAQEISEYTKHFKDMIQSFKDDYGQSILDDIQSQIDALEHKMGEDKYIKRLNRQIEAEKERLKLLKQQDDEEAQKTEEIRKQKELIASLQRQKDIRVYRADKGWTWESDKAKIKEEQDNLKDMESDLEIIKVERAIEKLEDRLADATKAYTDQIDALEATLKDQEYHLKLMQEKDKMTFEELTKNLDLFGANSEATFKDLLAYMNEIRKALGLEALNLDFFADTGTGQAISGMGNKQAFTSGGVKDITVNAQGKTTTEGLVAGDIVKVGGNYYEITGGTAGNYTSKPYNVPTSSSGGGSGGGSGGSTGYVDVSSKGSGTGTAPGGLKPGTIVHTDAGDYKITGGDAGSYTKEKVNDRGGLNYGKGYMKKDVVEPERVLSPEQTQTFEKLVTYLPHFKPLITTGGGFDKFYKTNTSSSTDNSIVISHLVIQAPNGATFDSLMKEAKNLSKINKK